MRYRRLYQQGGCYFLTLVLRDRSSDILVRKIVALKSALRFTQARHEFYLNALVVLPDHLHVLITLHKDSDDFSSVVRDWKKRFGFLIGEKRIWQARFWEHLIRDEEDYANHFHYIHGNPVKHGHVTKAADWPYSSFHRAMKQGLYDLLWTGRDEWQDVLYDT